MNRSEQYKAEGRAAIIALREYLSYIISNPGEFSSRDDLTNALGSQGGMVSLNAQVDTKEVSIKVTPMSLNTAKKYAAKCLPQGFETLEKLRGEALSALLALTAPPKKKTNKEHLKKQNYNLELEVESLINSNLVLLQCVSIAMGALDSVRTERDGQLREKIILDTSLTLKAALSINKPPFNSHIKETNVTPIGKRKSKNELRLHKNPKSC